MAVIRNPQFEIFTFSSVCSFRSFVKQPLQCPGPKRVVLVPIHKIAAPMWCGIGRIGYHPTPVELAHGQHRIAGLFPDSHHIATVARLDDVVAQNRRHLRYVDTCDCRMITGDGLADKTLGALSTK